MMKITYSNIIRVDDPTIKMKAWCESNLVVPNPEFDRRVRRGLWLGNTPSTIDLYETVGDSFLLPYGVLGRLYATFKDEADWVDGFPVYESEFYKISLAQIPEFMYADIPLYEYQEKAVQKMLDSRMGILQAPAGSGKTQMGIALAARLGKRTLWIVHTKDLLKQAYERAKLYMPESILGTITEGSVNIGSAMTFATVQTLSKLNLPSYKNYWDTVIVDECHRVSGSPTTVTMYLKVLNALAARHKYGLSATVHRSDGLIQSTYALLGTVKHEVDEMEVADKIMRVSVCKVFTGVQIDEQSLNWDGTLNYAKYISFLAGHEPRSELIMDVFIENDMDYHPTLFLSDRLEHLETLMQMLPDYIRERDAVMISGRMTSKKDKALREQALEDMRTGKKKILFATYSLAKEGLDIPCLERLYLTTPHRDYAVITQAIGRIARTSENKDVPVAYDFVDADVFSQKSWKQRRKIYEKNGCEFVG